MARRVGPQTALAAMRPLRGAVLDDGEKRWQDAFPRRRDINRSHLLLL
jgi:hypothetical protein